jgi:hypothetical protein
MPGRALVVVRTAAQSRSDAASVPRRDIWNKIF